ncbi:hypothetical protein ACF3NG_01485 [Aerococcaceae bacterium WGS1372]
MVKEFLTEGSRADVSRAYCYTLAKGYVNHSWIKLLQTVEENQREQL